MQAEENVEVLRISRNKKFLFAYLTETVVVTTCNA